MCYYNGSDMNSKLVQCGIDIYVIFSYCDVCVFKLPKIVFGEGFDFVTQS